jgi:hypothetical protein
MFKVKNLKLVQDNTKVDSISQKFTLFAREPICHLSTIKHNEAVFHCVTRNLASCEHVAILEKLYILSRGWGGINDPENPGTPRQKILDKPKIH